MVTLLPARAAPAASLTASGSIMRRIVIAALSLATTAALTAAVRPSASSAHAGATARQAFDDATIVAIFDAANTADIETGQLAAERGHTKEVRDFGAMLARDHKMVRQQG